MVNPILALINFIRKQKEITIKKNEIKSYLALIVLVLSGIACSLTGTSINVSLNKGTTDLACMRTIWMGQTTEINCTATCPGGGTAKFKSNDEELNQFQFLILTPEKLVAKNCPTAAAAQSVKVLAPVPSEVLTGDISACDPAAHMMKLKLADGYTSAMFTDQKPIVTLGDQGMSCTANESDHTLDCLYPDNATLTAQIKVNIGGTLVNNFSFDGKACLPPPLPILTGEVTYCAVKQHVISLRLVNGFNPQEFKHQLTMGGVALQCAVNPSNTTLLTCSYPDTIKFPADVQVTLNGQVVNDFSYDGSGCTAPRKSDGSGSNCDPNYILINGICVGI
jgi:hypothetical protein